MYHNMKLNKLAAKKVENKRAWYYCKIDIVDTYLFKLDYLCWKRLSKLANNKCGMLGVLYMQIAEIKFYMISAILRSSSTIYEKQEVNHE